MGSIKNSSSNPKNSQTASNVFSSKCKCWGCYAHCRKPGFDSGRLRFGGRPGTNPERSGSKQRQIEEVAQAKLAVACECIKKKRQEQKAKEEEQQKWKEE